MFYSLPEEIKKYIYEFDGTYRDIFNEIVSYSDILNLKSPIALNFFSL